MGGADIKESTPRGAPTCPQGLVHRGFFHERTAYEQSYRNNRRETVFAKAWEAENAHLPGRHHICDRSSRQGLLDALMTKQEIAQVGHSGFPRDTRVGVYDQNAAAVAATVVQWLGSNIGFSFLAQTLAQAGYDIVDRKTGAKEV